MGTKIKNGIFTVLIVLFSSTIFAQTGMQKSKHSGIIKKQIDFIIKELQLTEKEKTSFIPFYKEYLNKKMDLHKQKRKSMQSFRKNNLNMTDEELLNLSNKLIDNDMQLSILRKEYHKKYIKTLPPIKTVLLYRAEQQFKKELFKQMRRKRGK